MDVRSDSESPQQWRAREARCQQNLRTCVCLPQNKINLLFRQSNAGGSLMWFEPSKRVVGKLANAFTRKFCHCCSLLCGMQITAYFVLDNDLSTHDTAVFSRRIQRK
ncbi:unnamed protein product, partial [Ectocarpus sp. 8 AP-2014]